MQPPRPRPTPPTPNRPTAQTPVARFVRSGTSKAQPHPTRHLVGPLPHPPLGRSKPATLHKATSAADANLGLMSQVSRTEIWRTILAVGPGRICSVGRAVDPFFGASDGLVRRSAGGIDRPWCSVMGEPSVGRRFPPAPCGTPASRRKQRPRAHPADRACRPNPTAQKRPGKSRHSLPVPTTSPLAATMMSSPLASKTRRDSSDFWRAPG